MIETQIELINNFLEKYKWVKEPETDVGILVYNHTVFDFSIDIIYDDWIAIVQGDNIKANIPINLYALIGYMVTNRVLPYDYSM